MNILGAQSVTKHELVTNYFRVEHLGPFPLNEYSGRPLCEKHELVTNYFRITPTLSGQTWRSLTFFILIYISLITSFVECNVVADIRDRS